MEQAAGEAADPGRERGEDRINLLLRLRAQTEQQLLDYKSMIDANEERTPEQIMQENQIKVKIEDLKNEIEDVKTAFEVRNLALNRMKLSVALKNNMESKDMDSSVLTDDMKHILKLNKLIMKLQEESWELEKKLLDVRKERLQLKEDSRSKLLEIQTKKNKQKDLESMNDSDRIKTMQKSLQREIEITTVIQNVFQGLILGSKTNWAEDSALKEVVLQLEKNLTTI